MCDCLHSEEGEPTFPSLTKDDIRRMERKVKGYKKGLAPSIKIQKEHKKDTSGNHTDEMDILIQEATQRREIINAKLGGNITKLRKQMEWERIATAVSAVSGIKRTWKA